MKYRYILSILFMFISINICSISFAQDIQLLDVNKIKDANPLNNYWSNYADGGYGKFEYAAINGTVYFSADDGMHGIELWRSDGTNAGTTMVKDINPGIASSQTHSITVSNGKVFFAADDGKNGIEIWSSDGTAAGTKMIKDIYSGLGSSSPSFLTDVNGVLYFFTNHASVADQLWKTDGTATGTQRVANFYTSKFSFNGYANQLINVNGRLFFVLRGNGDAELYTSNGTTAGTGLVKDINPFGSSDPWTLTPMNGLLYFSAEEGSGRKLWVSDGSDAGTYAVNNINNIFLYNDAFNNNLNKFAIKGNKLFFPGYGWDNDGSKLCSYDASDPSNNVEVVKNFVPGSPSHNLYNLVNVNGTIFFTVYAAYDGGQTLWKSDGTTDGTLQVKNINPGGRNIYWYKEFKDANGTLLFSFYDEIHGTELWRSDGTEAGTVVVKEMGAGAISGNATCITYAGNNTTFFGATNGATGQELWKTDGTAAGTVLVKNINQISNPPSDPAWLTPALDSTKLLFTATNRNVGNELWISDGASSGTKLAKDVIPGSSSSNPNSIVSCKKFSCFVASVINNSIPNTSDEFYIMRLFVTDGTITGTSPIEVPYLDSIVGNIGGLGSIVNFVATNDLIYFLVFNYVGYYYELWRTDGTTAGTYCIKSNMNPYYYPYTISAGNVLLFTKFDEVNGYGTELWRTDGSVAGTYLMKSGISADLYASALIGNTLFFRATDETHGTELWKSNGTESGTKLVKDIATGNYSSYPSYPVILNNEVIFSAVDEFYQLSLWSSNGTESGTKILRKNVVINNTLGVVNGKLFFSAEAPAKGNELWVTNGTSIGTRLVKDINPGPNGSNPYAGVAIDKLLYFVAYDGVHGFELWKSNGTAPGTKLVKDIAPNDNSSNISNMANGGDRLYFILDSKLWSSDGTADGTVPVNDPDLMDASLVSLLQTMKNKIFFIANTPEKGNELYAINTEGAGIRSPDIENMLKAPVAESFVNIYPNPTISNATLIIPGKLKDVAITMTDASGKILWQGSYRDQNRVNLPTENLAAGVYMITITGGNETKTAKLVKE